MTDCFSKRAVYVVTSAAIFRLRLGLPGFVLCVLNGYGKRFQKKPGLDFALSCVFSSGTLTVNSNNFFWPFSKHNNFGCKQQKSLRLEH